MVCTLILYLCYRPANVTRVLPLSASSARCISGHRNHGSMQTRDLKWWRLKKLRSVVVAEYKLDDLQRLYHLRPDAPLLSTATVAASRTCPHSSFSYLYVRSSCSITHLAHKTHQAREQVAVRARQTFRISSLNQACILTYEIDAVGRSFPLHEARNSSACGNAKRGHEPRASRTW